MFFRQYQLACLSLFSYLIGDETTGRAVVVDPQRDISGYLDDAASTGCTSSGSSRRTSTPTSSPVTSSWPTRPAPSSPTATRRGPTSRSSRWPTASALALGDVVLEIRHTPGHTPESIASSSGSTPTTPQPWAVLTGDALFIGDVGRPDLLTSVGWTADDLARQLYRSLHDKLLTLPDARGSSRPTAPVRRAASRCPTRCRRRSVSSGSSTTPCAR